MREKFSLFQNIWQTTPVAEIGVEEMVQIVKSDTLKPYTDRVCHAKTKEEKDKAKGCLPNVTLNGIFSKRGNAYLTEYSGITCLDFDHIPLDSWGYTRKCLREWAWTLFLFTSPSGDGMKVGIRHNLEDPNLHWNLYGHLTKQFREEFGCEWVDMCTKDIQRGTYLPYDPDCFFNPNALVYPYEFDPTIEQKNTTKQKDNQAPCTINDSPMTPEMLALNEQFQAEWKDKSLVNYIDKHQWSAFPEDYHDGNRNNSILKKAGQLYRCGVSYECALEKLIHLYSHTFSDYPEQEVISRVEYIYNQGSNDFGVDRQIWLDKREEGMKQYKNGTA